jgi:hypothetical protein
MADLDVGWLNWPGEWASNEARVQAQSAFAWSYADWGHVTPDLGALASLEKT